MLAASSIVSEQALLLRCFHTLNFWSCRGETSRIFLKGLEVEKSLLRRRGPTAKMIWKVVIPVHAFKRRGIDTLDVAFKMEVNAARSHREHLEQLF